MVTALLAAALAASAGTAPGSYAAINLRSAAIRIGDVIAGMHGPAAAIEIARLPAARPSVTLSRRAVAALVRRAVPAITFDDNGPARITFHRGLPAIPAPVCFVAREAIAAGDTIGADRVQPGRCAANGGPVRYVERTGTIVASGQIAAGDIVGRVPPKAAPAVARGDAMTLITRSGPVTIERHVAALQPGRPGGRVFVHTACGQVFAVRLAEQRP